jgi:hypothetical protein
VSQIDAFPFNKSEDDEEEDPALIAWEMEWWAKEAAIIH